MPVPVLVGQSNTNKSFTSKVAACLVGLHRNAVYNDLTPAKCVSLLGRSLFFIYNDPKDSGVLQTLITKVRTRMFFFFFAKKHPSLISSRVRAVHIISLSVTSRFLSKVPPARFRLTFGRTQPPSLQRTPLFFKSKSANMGTFLLCTYQRCCIA